MHFKNSIYFFLASLSSEKNIQQLTTVLTKLNACMQLNAKNAEKKYELLKTIKNG